jgi:hypothetical protein
VTARGGCNKIRRLGGPDAIDSIMVRKRTAHTYTLRRASSVVFCLISLLPLLLFVYTLYALNALNQMVAQIGLASALVMSMIGFYIYSGMIAGLSAILRDLETAEAEPEPPPAGTVVTAAVEPTPGTPAPALPRAPAAGLRPSPFAARDVKGTGGRASLVVPGMGRITELKPANSGALADLDSMWKIEAEPLLGRRVLVAVRNAAEPIKGTLAQVTNDGVLLDQSDGSKTGISYNRMSAIEADTSPEPA